MDGMDGCFPGGWGGVILIDDLLFDPSDRRLWSFSFLFLRGVVMVVVWGNYPSTCVERGEEFSGEKRDTAVTFVFFLIDSNGRC